MGIKNFFNFITKYAPSSISYHGLQHYSNKILGIDTNLLLYKLKFNYKQKTTHIIHDLIIKLNYFEKYNIKPIFIFDGPPPNLKLPRKTTVSLPATDIQDCQNILQLYGYPVIIASGEADIQLALMARKGVIDYVVSDDMDIIIFGGKDVKLIKNLSVRNDCIEIDGRKVLEGSGLTHLQLIHFAILIGCDYCKKERGIGISKGIKMIKEGWKGRGVSEAQNVVEYFLMKGYKYRRVIYSKRAKDPEVEGVVDKLTAVAIVTDRT